MAFDKRKALQNALAYTQQGKWDRAIGEYQSILRADPRDVTVYNNLGDLFARAGKTAEAIDQYLKLGELYRADGLSVKAIAVYKKIAKLDPARTEAYLACADLYWEQGLIGEAKIQIATVLEHYSKAGETAKLVDAYKRLAQFDPTNPSVLVRLADTLLRDGKREAAAGEYDRASQAAQAAGQAAEAKRLHQKARDLAPRAPEATISSAERLINEGNIPDGLDVLKAVTSAEPSNAKAWRLLGEAWAVQSRAGESLAALERAVSLGVPEAEVAQPLGRALVQAGRVDDAIALCRRVTDACLAKGESELAIACCRALLEAAPQVVALHAHLAATLDRLGRAAEACVALRALAATQEATGAAAAAVATYQRLIALDPLDAEARGRLEALEPPSPPPPEVPEAIPPPAEVQVSEVQVASPVPVQVEAPDPLTSPLDDLGLALGSEDAALLLEEPDAATLAVVPDAEAVAQEVPVAGGANAGATSSESTDWLTQGLQAIDLERAASDVRAETSDLEWVPGRRTPDAEEVSPPEREPELVLEVSAAALDQASTLIDVPAIELPEVPVVEFPDVPAEALDEQSSLIDVPAVELPDVPTEPDASLLGLRAPALAGEWDALVENDAHSGHVAEQLAEADVYQKYGLEEKARERLVEVVRLAPENLTARQRLKSIYVNRSQYDAACQEILAIARILRTRREEDAAFREVREGLALVPTHPELQQLLLAAPPTEGMVTVERASSSPSRPRSREGATPGSVGAPMGVTAAPAGGAAGQDGAPPPDVPLLLDWDQAVPSLEAPIEGERGSGPADGEALPKELQALLENEEAEPVVVVDETRAAQDHVMADDIAEAEFYLSQGMTDEARAVHRRMQLHDSEDPAVLALAEQIERASSPSRAAEPELIVAVEPGALEEALDAERASPSLQEPATPEVAEFTVADATPEETPAGFVDLGAELAYELDAGEQATPSPASAGPLVDGLIKELQKGVREQLDEKDYETHYNLGIAYKEMELYDEAIQEFRLTAREPKRALECADLVGLCYLAKGQPEQAAQDLQAGLAIEGHPPEAYHNLRYDLGTAFEAGGDLARALEQFEILQAEGARFLDVQTRVQTLRSQLSPPSSPATTAEKPRRKKKISFI